MTLFWILLGLMVLVGIFAVVKPFIFTRQELSRGHTAFLAGTVAVMSLSAFFLYDQWGEPDLVANPPEPVVTDEVVAMIRQLEQVMEQNPNDPEGWMLLARAYTRMGNVRMAIGAYRNVVTLDPTDTRAAAALGGMLIANSSGQVPQEAMQLFRGIIEQGVQQPMAYYYLGLGNMQQGNYEEAYEVWSVLAENSPQGAPWNDMLRESLREVSSELGKPMPNLPPPLEESGGE